jgi:hypothetical protein
LENIFFLMRCSPKASRSKQDVDSPAHRRRRAREEAGVGNGRRSSGRPSELKLAGWGQAERFDPTDDVEFALLEAKNVIE